MRISINFLFRAALRACARPVHPGWLVLVLAVATPIAGHAGDAGQTFATPEEAISALMQATSTANDDASRAIFGPAAEDLENPDRVQATNDLNTFTTSFNA